MAGTTNWQLCILCQNQTTEKPVCPLANPIVSHREGAYTELISLARQFRAIGAAPHPDVELPDEESMHQNCAVVSFTSQQHLTMQKCYSEGLPPATRRSCRTGAPVNRKICIFCGDETNAADHSFQKVELSHQIHDIAVALGEDRIVALLSEGDLVAIEAKYHRNCYTGFKRH